MVERPICMRAGTGIDTTDSPFLFELNVFAVMCNHTDLSLMSCTLPAKIADLLLLISNLFFFKN